MDIQEKIVWPGWETVRIIGRGSYGAVYEIRRDIFGQTESAAVKVISIPQNASDIEELRADGYDENSITETFKDRMRRITEEYSLMRKLNGTANVVNSDDIHCRAHADGIGWDIFIKMELLTALPKVLPQQADDALAAKIGMDICCALECCGQYNIVHRDIKPQNLFMSPNGDFKLGDFGIARTMEHTIGGTRIGTYKYMAPEIYNNRPYNRLADIYSLGMVLYWMMNERRMPFVPLPPQIPTAADDGNAGVRRFGGEPLPAPLHGSRALKKVILKACEFDQAKRYQNAEEMREALHRAVPGADAVKMRGRELPDIDGTVTIPLPGDRSVSAGSLDNSAAERTAPSAAGVSYKMRFSAPGPLIQPKEETAGNGTFVPQSSSRPEEKRAERKAGKKKTNAIVLAAVSVWVICLITGIVLVTRFLPQKENAAETVSEAVQTAVPETAATEPTATAATPAVTANTQEAGGTAYDAIIKVDTKG